MVGGSALSGLSPFSLVVFHLITHCYNIFNYNYEHFHKKFQKPYFLVIFTEIVTSSVTFVTLTNTDSTVLGKLKITLLTNKRRGIFCKSGKIVSSQFCNKIQPNHSFTYSMHMLCDIFLAMAKKIEMFICIINHWATLWIFRCMIPSALYILHPDPHY